MNKPIHIYKEIDTRDRGAEYYQAYLAPYGLIASIHGFESFPNGIITMTVTNHIAYEWEVRQAFNQYKQDKH